MTSVMASVTTQPTTNVMIVGSGAIGLLWYSHFCLCNNKAVNCFLYQSPTRKTLQHSILFASLSNQKTTFPSKVITSSNEHSIDIILVCVKSYQLNQAIADIAPFITLNTLVITTHNGLGALNTESTQLLQNNNVFDLLTTHGCLKLSENKIVHTGAGVSHLGRKFGKKSPLLETKTTQLLHSVLPEVIWCEDILSKQWLKLAINCVINPLTALHNIKNGALIHEKFENTINQLIDEIVVIAHLKNISLNKESLKETVYLVAQNTAKNSSSMRCDVQQGRQTEVEYINGYIHRLGQELNIPTPKNTELYQRVLAL
ncbi:ketopantoate reductase family protein [Pseudocolwellia agarivorans]|uniref:ketopantoate reductase family protein n=1 Tax=Pseudocolwellia agarivorans TaxID=1911682 RepID=UPI000984A34C|nr:2-dehydropantoate 2-reductase [Pseudocolwellia agarivorans]